MNDGLSWIRLLPPALGALVGVLAIAAWQRRARTPRRWLAIGGAVWAVSVATTTTSRLTRVWTT